MYPKPHFVDVRQDVIVPCLLTAAQHNTRTTHSLDPRPLPEFWEQRKNEHGVAYFVASLAAYSHVVLTFHQDHRTQKTVWSHPCAVR